MKCHALAALVLVPVLCALKVPVANAQLQGLALGEQDQTTRYTVASVLVNSSNLYTSYLNITSPGSEGAPKWAPYVGVLGGLAGIGLGGASLLDENPQDQGLGVTNIPRRYHVALRRHVRAPSRREPRRGCRAGAGEDAHPNAVHFAAGIHKGRVPGLGVSLKF
jgi:hypothetical protein